MSTKSHLPNPAPVVVTDPVLTVACPGFPAPVHEAEADLFCRQAAMPSHDQERLEAAHLAVVGCGGLGSWIALAGARMGIRRMTIMDADCFDRTNAPRQMMLASDIGRPKAHALANNLVPHMTNTGTITAVALSFHEALNHIKEPPTVMVVGVDNNSSRLAASKWGLEQGVPVVFAMLSTDGLRAQVFLQEPGGPCLSCVLPNLEVNSNAPCAAAAVTSCMLAAAHATTAVAAVVMGGLAPPRWREVSLDGSTERLGNPSVRTGCTACGSND